MERLVLEFQMSDGITYCDTVTYPILYESAEQLAVDIEEFCKSDEEFEICGNKFIPYDFYEDGKYYTPNIYTLDEWFSQVKG